MAETIDLDARDFAARVIRRLRVSKPDPRSRAQRGRRGRKETAMANEKTVKYSAKCPHCGLSATGTLTLNVNAYAWLDWAWDAHVKACRANAESKKE